MAQILDHLSRQQVPPAPATAPPVPAASVSKSAAALASMEGAETALTNIGGFVPQCSIASVLRHPRCLESYTPRRSAPLGFLIPALRRPRITKPLTFADCVGDELPLGWEVVYDQQIGVYYIDHINKITQIEDPRTLWRQEQERMLKEYLVVAKEALDAKKEIYLIKQQRLELAQQEYLQLHQLAEEDIRSHVSSFSGSSSNTKYDPDQIKAEIARRRERLSRLKQELVQMKQELQYKELGVETLQEIDRKMSSSQTNYKLDEAQAIVNELRTIKRSINTGEKERQDLIQSLAKLTIGFRSSCCINDSLPDPQNSAGVLSDSCLPQQYCDAGSQTDVIGEFGTGNTSRLGDRVRLSWQYEEAKKSWPGRAEADRDRERLQLLREKEALLQELTLISQHCCSPDDALHLEAERRRLEEEIQRAHSSSAHGTTERILQQEKRNVLLRQLEEATRVATYLHSQLKSFSASNLMVSSGSSRGSLASSRGSLASSRGSLSSVSFTDIYGPSQYERTEGGGFRDLEQHLRFDQYPFDAVFKDTTVYEAEPLSLGKPKRSLDTPQSFASLSSRSSLSSLSPPSSPLDTPYHSASRDSPLAQMTEEYMELAGRGFLEGLRGYSQPPATANIEAVPGAAPSGQFCGYLLDSKGPKESVPQIGYDAGSECLLVHLLQLKNLNKVLMKEVFKIILQQEKRNVLLRQLEEATRVATYLHSQLKSFSASNLMVSSGSSRGSLASSRGSLASSRGSLSSVSFTDIYGPSQYERTEGGGLSDLEQHLRFDLYPFDAVFKDTTVYGAEPLSLGKPKRSLDTPQSFASLSSRSSLSSLSPPSSPLDTPYHSASRDSLLAQMTEEYMELAGRGFLEGLRGYSQPHNEAAAGAAPSGQFCGYLLDSKGPKESVPQIGRPEDSEVHHVHDAASTETPQIQLGLMYDAGNECLLVHLLQLKNLNEVLMKEVFKIYVKIHMLPLDPSTASTYCSKALDLQTLLTFNEGFRIPVPASALGLRSLQLYVCSVGHQAQEELLGVVQVSLADCDGSPDMSFHWYRVQTVSGPDPHRKRNSIQFAEGSLEHPGNRMHVKTTDSVSALLARTTAQLEAVERELAGEQVKLEYTDEEIQEMERKEEQAEAVSERSWQAESVDSGCSNSTAFGPHCPEGLCGEVAYREPEGRCAARRTRPPPLKVDKETNTESLFTEKLSFRLKDRGSHRSHGSPFVRSSTIVRSQTFSPGAQSQYVCRVSIRSRLYRSDSDSSTLPKRSPFIRNTLERRTLRYKQQSYRSSLEEQSTRTSLDLELDLQASRTRQRQLNEELSSLRELRLRLEEAQGRGITELPHWVIFVKKKKKTCAKAINLQVLKKSIYMYAYILYY
ncbi:UNVERIFIED_CONTAM: hypothetical protein FKN15_038520 [Acipenser sinensis]